MKGKKKKKEKKEEEEVRSQGEKIEMKEGTVKIGK